MARARAAQAGAPPDVSKMTVAALKEQLRARGLKVAGRKAELAERLAGAVRAEAEEADPRDVA